MESIPPLGNMNDLSKCYGNRIRIILWGTTLSIVQKGQGSLGLDATNYYYLPNIFTNSQLFSP